MQPIKTVGVIINPRAGKGFAENAEIARLAAGKFPGAAILTGAGEMGAKAFSDARDLEICPCESPPGRQQTVALARALASRQVDLLLVVGGDGTMADVAFALVEMGMPSAATVPIVGIGMGSTNVGPLITCRGSEVSGLDIDHLETDSLPAALVKYQQTLLGIGFNDCILGFTVLGTLDGQVRDLDAQAKMKGINLLGDPDRPVGTPLTLIERISPAGTVEIARGEWVGSVAIGFSAPAFFGKAITGGICLAAYLNIPAGCLVSDCTMSRIEITRQEALALAVQRSNYVSFDETMCIRVSGMRSGTAVCADGNPLKILSPEDQVEFWVRPASVRAVKSVYTR
jgi:NAD kinase